MGRFGRFLVLPLMMVLGLSSPALARPGNLILASTSDTGVKGNDWSTQPSVSANGTEVAFHSYATNLDAADTDAFADVFVKDLTTDDITLASTSDTGVKGNEDSSSPSLAADGTRVAFMSDATNLDPADADSIEDIYVKDLTTGDIILASTSEAGIKGDDESRFPSLSADGTKVAFFSDATNLDPADTDTAGDIYVKDLVTGDIILASTSDTGVKGNRSSFTASLSAGGTKVAFYSNARRLDPADTDFLNDVYVKDVGTGDIILASTSAAGVKGDNGSLHAHLSANGTKVAFSSAATNLHPGDTDDSFDVYVKTLATGRIALASTSDRGVKGNDFSYAGSLSANGAWVAFQSFATNLDPADTDDLFDVYLKRPGRR